VEKEGLKLYFFFLFYPIRFNKMLPNPKIGLSKKTTTEKVVTSKLDESTTVGKLYFVFF
jgi:hypothetical protein